MAWKKKFKNYMLVIAVYLFVVFVIFSILVWRIEKEAKNEVCKPITRPDKVLCQFCDKEVTRARWFSRGWSCGLCWHELGLDDHVSERPKVWRTRWKIAEVKIEEIKCGDKL